MKLLKRFFQVVLLLVLAFSFYGCKDKSDKLIVDGIEIEKLSQLTDNQKGYMNDNYALITSYAKANADNSYPNVIKLKGDNLGEANLYSISISTDKNFDNIVLSYDNEINEFPVFNLKIHTVYFYKIKNCVTNEFSDIKGFMIDDPINILNISGIPNCRDLGGKLINGQYTNQGLIFRTSKFNKDESTESLITDNVSLSRLGIKTELDLRQTTDNENGGLIDSCINNAQYICIPMSSNGDIIKLNENKLVDVFKVFGNKDNYPIAFHCSIGTDRTGMVAFLLNAVLGVKEEDIYKDYLFSNFSNISRIRTSSTIDKYIDTVSKCDGETLQEKTYNYLLSIGVDKADIENYIDIMTK